MYCLYRIGIWVLSFYPTRSILHLRIIWTSLTSFIGDWLRPTTAICKRQKCHALLRFTRSCHSNEKIKGRRKWQDFLQVPAMSASLSGFAWILTRDWRYRHMEFGFDHTKEMGHDLSIGAISWLKIPWVANSFMASRWWQLSFTLTLIGWIQHHLCNQT